MILLIMLVVCGCASNGQLVSLSRPPEVPPLPLASSHQILSAIRSNGHHSYGQGESQFSIESSGAKHNSQISALANQKYQTPLPIDEVFKLTKEQEEDFLKAFYSRPYQSLNPNRRVYEYLKNYLHQFNFYSDTLIAREALDKQLGNCLSLAIVTKALARLVDIKVSYELVSTTPVFQREGDITLSSQHVRTILYAQAKNDDPFMYSLGTKTITVDYFPSQGSHRLRRVSEPEFYSMYYRNKAAESLIQRDLYNAYLNTKQALVFAPMDAQAINLMAVIHHRAGFKDIADQIYQYALHYGTESLELLSNYHSFLVMNQRFAEAEKIQKKVEAFENLNPFVWVDLGNSAFANKNYKQAIRYYKRAARMADYIHEPWLGMARSYYMMGKLDTAKKMMARAIEKSHKNETKSLYQKKYEMLSKLAAQ